MNESHNDPKEKSLFIKKLDEFILKKGNTNSELISVANILRIEGEYLES